MNHTRQRLAVDKHAVAIKDDEIEGEERAQVLSSSRVFSSNGTQYSSSR
jgi:hypothetical protein